MGIILGILFVFGIAIFIVLKTSTENTKNLSTQYSTSKKSLKENNPKTTNKATDIVKKKSILNLELKGIFYNHYKKIGNFKGTVKQIPSKHDKHCVGIYIDNILAGYSPKGSQKLFYYLSDSGKNNICWGNIHYDEYHNQYSGNFYTPIYFPDEEIKEIETIFLLIPIQNILFAKENKKTQEYFELLNNDIIITTAIFEYKIEGTNYSFNRNTIPEFSKKLETEKDWQNLVKLENYKSAINDLSLKYKNSTLKRIEKANNIISNTQTD